MKRLVDTSFFLSVVRACGGGAYCVCVSVPEWLRFDKVLMKSDICYRILVYVRLLSDN